MPVSHAFHDRLNGMRKIVLEALKCAAEDAAALQHDRTIHPTSRLNERGEQEWCGSEAATLLAIDMEQGKHLRMKPEVLYYLRLQYQEFPLNVFRGHIYQETHTLKWREQWVDGKKEYTIVENTGT